MLVAGLGIGLSVWFAQLKFQTTLEAAARSRMAVPLATARDALQASLSLGLPLASATAVPDLLRREKLADAAILELQVLDTAGQVLFTSGTGRLAGADAVLSDTLRNPFDLAMGEVRVHYRLASEQAALAALQARLWRIGIGAWAGTVVLALVLGWLSQTLVRRLQPSRPAPQAAALLGALLIGMVAAAGLTQMQVDAGLRPHLERKAAVVGASVAELVAKAMGYQIAMPELVGVPAHLSEVRAQHPELSHLLLRDAAGAQRFESGLVETGSVVSVPIRLAGQVVGSVEVGVSGQYLRRSLQESGLSLLVLFIVAALLAREALGYLSAQGQGAASTGAVRLARLRLPLLLFMLAEELTRAFVPAFAQVLLGAQAAAAAPWLAGLPIVFFMLMVALAQPVLAVWSERMGLRRALVLGALLGALGLAGAAMAQSLYAFIGWRALGGVGYALVFVASQGYVLAHSSLAERTRAFAGFVSAIMVAAVCGPPLGGLLADHLGARWGFAAAACVAVLACLAVAQLPAPTNSGQAAPAKLRPQDLGRLLGQPGFRQLTLLAAVPAKLVLAGLCFYLVPLYLAQLGEPAAAAGRAQMLYALSLLIVLPWATRWAERGVPLAHLVGMGLCVSSLGALGLLLTGGAVPVLLAMVFLGAGQGLSIAAQSSLLPLWCATELERNGPGALFGFYRLIERLGNAAGPLLAAALLMTLGPQGGFAGLGALALVCGLLFLINSPRARVPVAKPL